VAGMSWVSAGILTAHGAGRAGLPPMLPEAQRAMLGADLGRCVFACILVLATSLVIYFPNTVPTWFYGRVFEQAPSPIYFIREMCYLLVLGMMGWLALRNRAWLPISTEAMALIAVFLILAGIEFTRLAAMGYPLVMGIYGLRFLQFLPVVALFYYSGRYFGDRHLAMLAVACRIFTIVQAITGIAQVLTMPPVYGSTIFGARAFGSLPLPHHFGMTMGLVSILFLFTMRHGNAKWFWLSAALTLISGSRLGILLAGLGLVFFGLMAIRHRTLRSFCIMLLPVIVGLAFIGISSPEISGRETQGLSDARLSIWTEAIAAHAHEPGAFLLGWGMGIGAAATIAEFGVGHWTGVFMCDSFLMFLFSGYGILGVVFYLCALGVAWMRGNRHAMPWILAVVLFMNFAFMSWELFPINLLSAALLGWGIGDRSWSPHRLRQAVATPIVGTSMPVSRPDA
jgi:hypothetical protein